MPPARIHRTPAEAVQAMVREQVHVGDRSFVIERPDSADLFFDHPQVRQAYADDEFIPYWTEVWPASCLLAQAVLAEPWEQYSPNTPVLELACGLGLAGLAALARGLSVTFSDIDELALDFAGRNAQLNGFSRYACQAIDLRSPPANLQAPIILGADLLYEPRLLEAVIPFLRTCLAPGGICLIADPDRVTARPFGHLAEKANLRVERQPIQGYDDRGQPIFGAIYRLTHQG